MAKQRIQPVPKQPTRKQLSRAERDARRTRNLLLGAGGAVVVAVLAIVIGLVRDNVVRPNEPIAIVGGEQILTREFQQRVRLQRLSMIQQYQFLAQLGATDNASQIEVQLSDVQGLGSTVVTELVNEALFRQAAPELGVNISAEELQTSIEESLGYFRNPPTPEPSRTPPPTPTASTTITVTPTATNTPAPTSTPLTEEGFRDEYRLQLENLGRIGFNEADYRHYVETQLIAQKVQEIISSDVITSGAQVQLQYISAPTQEQADQVLEAVQTDGFDMVYSSVLSSTFPLTTVTGFETPFVTRDQLSESPRFGEEFTNLAFSANISSTFTISSTDSTAFYVALVLAREEDRAFDPSLVQQLQDDAVREWLNQRRENTAVEILTWEDRVPSTPTLQSIIQQ